MGACRWQLHLEACKQAFPVAMSVLATWLSWSDRSSDENQRDVGFECLRMKMVANIGFKEPLQIS